MTATTADFIEVYPDALDADTCRAIVARFDASGQDQPGRVGGGHYPELKHSRDISINGQADWRDVEQRLNLAVLAGLQQYLRTYPFSLIAPLMLQQPDADGTLRRLRYDDVANMDEAALMKLVMKVFVPAKAAIRTGTASCSRRHPMQRHYTATCCGRSTSTTASAPAKPSSSTSSARSCRAPAAC
jgi:hypothetical protein